MNCYYLAFWTPLILMHSYDPILYIYELLWGHPHMKKYRIERVNQFFTWICMSLSGCDPLVFSQNEFSYFVFFFQFSYFWIYLFFQSGKSCIFHGMFTCIIHSLLFLYVERETFRIKVGVNDICLKSWQPSKKKTFFAHLLMFKKKDDYN